MAQKKALEKVTFLRNFFRLQQELKERRSTAVNLSRNFFRPSVTRMSGKGKKGGGKKAGGGKKGSASKSAVQKEKVAQLSEADRRAQAIEMAQRMLAEKIATEKANIEAEEKKVKTSWSHILRLATVETVHASVELLSAEHERQSLLRDARIRGLESDLKDAEDTHRAALHGHNLQVDRMLRVHQSRLEGLEEAFDDAVKEMMADHEKEMTSLKERHRTDKRKLKALIATISEAETLKTLEAEQAQVTMREELRNKATDRVTLLSHQLDDRIVELEESFERAHIAYLTATDAKTQSFAALVAENAKAEKRIDRRSMAVDRAKAALVSLRNKMAASQREGDEKNSALSQQKAEQQAHLLALKARLEKFRALSDARLNTLSKHAAKTRATLRQQLDLATRVLTLAERVRQLEGDQERVEPFRVPDVAAGPEPGSLLVGPHAAIKAAGLSAATSMVEGAEGEEGGALEEAVTLPFTAEMAVISAGGLVPPEMTAISQGFTPLLDGQPSTATPAVETMPSIVTAPSATQPLALGLQPESALLRSTLEDGELEALDLFWRRFNSGLLTTMTWEQRREQLASENRRLKALLENCIESTTVSDRTFSRAEGNSLMVTNGRAGVCTPFPLIGQMTQAAATERTLTAPRVSRFGTPPSGSPFDMPSPAQLFHGTPPPTGASSSAASISTMAAKGRASRMGGGAAAASGGGGGGGGVVRTLFDLPAPSREPSGAVMMTGQGLRGSAAALGHGR